MNQKQRFVIKHSDILPDSIPLHELTDYLNNLENFINGLLKDSKIQGDKIPEISLVAIDSGSTSLAIEIDEPTITIPLVQLGFDTIALGGIESLPKACRANAIALTLTAKK